MESFRAAASRNFLPGERRQTAIPAGAAGRAISTKPLISCNFYRLARALQQPWPSRRLGERAARSTERPAWEGWRRVARGVSRWRTRFSSACRGRSRCSASSTSSPTTSPTSTPPASRPTARCSHEFLHAGASAEQFPRRRPAHELRAGPHDLARHRARARSSRPAIRSTSPSTATAFLVVQTPRGERYTRNGALQINATGELVTSDGDKVLGDGGPIAFQTDRPRHRRSPRTARSRCAKAPASTPIRTRGKLRLVRFANPQQLAEGRLQHLRRARRRRRRSRADANARVVQGAIEKSNVRGVIEMTRMIEVTRTYTADRQPCCSSRATCARNVDRASSPKFRPNDGDDSHARTSHRRDRNDGPGTQRPGHLQQHRQHAHDRLQAPARRIPGSALRARAAASARRPRRRATSCRSASISAAASRPSARRA